MNDEVPSDQPKALEVASKTPAPAAQNAKTSDQEIGLEQQIENLIETYHVTAEWIRFADAKAGVVLTVGGAFGGLLIPTMKTFLETPVAAHPAAWWVWLVMALLAACLFFLAWSFVFAFLCLTPFRLKGRHPAAETCPHFHAVGIAKKYRLDQLQEFIRGYQGATMVGIQREVLAALLIDAHISVTKYKNVTRSLRCVAWAALFGLIYLITAQF